MLPLAVPSGAGAVLAVLLLHVTSAEVPDAARGAYAGLFGRAGHDPGIRLDEMAAASARELVAAAAERLGRDCDRLEVHGRPERAVVAASAQADLLVVARDGDRTPTSPPFPRRRITVLPHRHIIPARVNRELTYLTRST